MIKSEYGAFTGKKSGLWARILKNRGMYLVLLPGLMWYVIFAFLPMYGMSLAFKTYKANLGIFRSPWAGLVNYQNAFLDPAFFQSIARTLQINFGRLLFMFPIPIILALTINEARIGPLKKIFQVIYTFPNFLSWVIVASIMINVLNRTGLVNSFILLLGGERVNFLGSVPGFLPLIYLSEIWKFAGWGAIIYLAAISGIDSEQYDAAEIDGASRLQQVFYVTIPGIMGTIIVMLILQVGNLMTSGFDQLFNLSNAATMKAAETLDMYIYRITFRSASDFSFSSAISLFRSVINFILLLTADRLSRTVSGTGLFAQG
ncbi:MAG: ABC transporter permease subunit [Treponema sp.]|jgi:putative aldouronate transport system permease protein|nr:ABC transporter permease subunit [Treponema sp.]